MKKLLLVLPFALLAGCEYHYRYPCQDPANWGKAECNNEICKADGECTSDVLGLPPNTQPTATWARPAPDAPKRFGNTESSDCAAPKPNYRKGASYDESDDSELGEDTFGYKQPKYTETETDKKVFAATDEGQESLYREPITMEERPITMNTIVNTKEHNRAATS